MSSYLIHYGIKGQKWGIRRYQNEDGTLTAEGKKRYLNEDGSYNDTAIKELKIKANNYSDKQRIRDKKLYGSNAEKRINKKMAKGEGIQSARHDEVVRKEKIEKNKSTIKRGARPLIKASLAIGSAFAIAYATPLVINKVDQWMERYKDQNTLDIEWDKKK
jgi:hypothetical protein